MRNVWHLAVALGAALLGACEGRLPLEQEPAINLALGPDPDKFVYVPGRPFQVKLEVECNSMIPIEIQWPTNFDGGLEVADRPEGGAMLVEASLQPVYREKRILSPGEIVPFTFEIGPQLEAIAKKDAVLHFRWRVGAKCSAWYRLVVIRDYKAEVRTGLGSFEIEFYSAQAPRAVMAFVSRAREGFYDGAPIATVVKGNWMIVGDPAKTDVPALPQEPDAPDGAGAVGLWYDLKPDSASHLFFVRFAEPKDFSRRYTVFGRVTGGQETLARIEAQGAGTTVETILVEEKK